MNHLAHSEAIDLFFEAMCDDFSYDISRKKVYGHQRIEETEEPGEVFLTEEELRTASIGLQHVDIARMSRETGEALDVVEDKVIEVAKKLG